LIIFKASNTKAKKHRYIEKQREKDKRIKNKNRMIGPASPIPPTGIK